MAVIVFNESLCNTVIYPIVMEFEGQEADHLTTLQIIESCKKRAEYWGCDWKDIFAQFVEYYTKIVELEEKL